MILPQASVVICTHNPRPHYLARVLDALKTQTLPFSVWELLLIDNASKDPLSALIDLSWHPAGRHVREDELGLTPARLRGIGEARGDLIVFADDDNVLDPDFLKQSLKIGESHPFLGAWGGTIRPEFEVEPEEWTKPHWGTLAIRDIRKPVWSNAPEFWQAQPCGAGLCIRASVAHCYLTELSNDPVRRKLDRTGSSLLSTGDTDLVLTSEKLGLGWGVYPSLGLTHLIPSARLNEEYLLRLSESMTASGTALLIRRGASVAVPPAWRARLEWLKTLIRRGPRAARFYLVKIRGIRQGLELAKSEE